MNFNVEIKGISVDKYLSEETKALIKDPCRGLIFGEVYKEVDISNIDSVKEYLNTKESINDFERVLLFYMLTDDKPLTVYSKDAFLSDIGLEDVNFRDFLTNYSFNPNPDLFSSEAPVDLDFNNCFIICINSNSDLRDILLFDEDIANGNIVLGYSYVANIDDLIDLLTVSFSYNRVNMFSDMVVVDEKCLPRDLYNLLFDWGFEGLPSRRDLIKILASYKTSDRVIFNISERISLWFPHSSSEVSAVAIIFYGNDMYNCYSALDIGSFINTFGSENKNRFPLILYSRFTDIDATLVTLTDVIDYIRKYCHDLKILFKSVISAKDNSSAVWTKPIIPLEVSKDEETYTLYFNTENCLFLYYE